MDYGAFPPEVNSARMYAGPGAGSMLAAAGAWDGLAADLHSTAAAAGSVDSGLTGGSWRGAASTSMAAAVAPVFDVDERDRDPNRAGGEPGQGGSRRLRGGVRDDGATSGDRHQPGPADGAGRDERAGANTPAIMATEAHYGEMSARTPPPCTATPPAPRLPRR